MFFVDSFLVFQSFSRVFVDFQFYVITLPGLVFRQIYKVRLGNLFNASSGNILCWAFGQFEKIYDQSLPI